MTTGHGIRLDPADAIELQELLQFLDGWLATCHDQMCHELTRFTGHPAYGTTQLRSDLQRFAFLLGADNGNQLFGG